MNRARANREAEMAGEWIPVSTGLTRRVEVLQIVRLLSGSPPDRSRHEVVGLLVEFWSWASAETADGRIAGVALADLPHVVGGDAGFWRAVCAVGWLVEDAAGLVVPKFDHWLSKGAKARLLDARRKAEARKRSGGAGPGSVRSESASRPPAVRNLSGAQPDGDRTTVEESRVDKNTPPTPPEGGGGGKESDRADRAAGDEQATGDVAARLVCEFYGAWRGADYRPPPAKLPAQIAAVGERIERHGLDLVRRGMRALPERLQREFPECREGLPAAWRLLDRILESLAAERRAKDRRRDEEAERRREEEARAAERAAWLERRPALMDRWRALSEPERAAIADAVPGAARLPAPLLLDECLRRMRDGDGGGC